MISNNQLVVNETALVVFLSILGISSIILLIVILRQHIKKHSQ